MCTRSNSKLASIVLLGMLAAWPSWGQVQVAPSGSMVEHLAPKPKGWMKSASFYAMPDGRIIMGTYFDTTKGLGSDGNLKKTCFLWNRGQGFKKLSASQAQELGKFLSIVNKKQSVAFEVMRGDIDSWDSQNKGYVRNGISSGIKIVGAIVPAEEKTFIWNEKSGFIDLYGFVQAIPSKKVGNWGLGCPYEISADGTTIVLGLSKGPDPNGTDVISIYNPKGFGPEGKLSGIGIGETRIVGTLKSVSGGKAVVEVESVQTAEKEAITLKPKRQKTVLLYSFVSVPAGFKPGVRVRITGFDDGAGKPLTASLIEKS